MSLKNQKPKDKKPRRRLFGRGSVTSAWWSKLVSRVGNMSSVKTLTQTDDTPEEPIDFSTPSIPYYTRLAEKFSLARIVLYMVLFAFVVVTLFSSRQVITYENLYYLVKDINAAHATAQSQAEYLNYPTSQASASFALFRGGLVVAGGDEITALSGAGKQTLSDNVSMTSPCVSAGGQYFLTYSRGEKNYAIYNAFVRVHKELTEFPVYNACMGQDGSYAVQTRSREYTSVVLWYDDDGDKLPGCYLGGYVTSLTISQDSRTLAVVSMDTKDGGYETKIILLQRGISGGGTTHEITRRGGVLGARFITSDRLCVVYEDGVAYYRLDGREQAFMPFEQEKPLLWCVNTGYVGIYYQDTAQLAKKALMVYDQNGREVYDVTVDDMKNPSSMVMDGQDVYLHDFGHILRVSKSGNDMASVSVDGNTLCMLVTGDGSLLVCTPAFARYIDSRDFE